MSRIQILPDELILEIASLLPHESSLAALALTNRRLHRICNPCLYRYNVLHHNSSALDWAAQHGRLDTVQNTLSAGAPLPKKQSKGELKEQGPSISQFRSKSRRLFQDFQPHPISLAAKAGHFNIVRYMIERGLNPNTKDPEWLTLLPLAAIHGHTSMAEYLLHLEARQGIRSFVGHRPVWLAAFKGHEDVVDLLLVSASRDDGKGPSKEDLMPDALFAAVIAGQVPVVRLLCTLGVQLNFFGYPGRSPLFVVASSGMSDLVSLFLAHGADPNFIADQRRSHAPLTAAVIEGHEDIIRTLVGGTANLHRTRALAFAIAQGNRQIAETLLRNGAPPQFHRAEIPTSFEDDDKEWVQPLLAAVQRNSLELVELLVDYGADVNVQCSEYPRTGFAKLFDRVLFWAVEESHEADGGFATGTWRRSGDC